jgi:hypothetical protein
MQQASWGGLLLLGCSAAVSPDPASSDAHTLHEDAEHRATFSCAMQADTGKVRVEMSAKNRWILVDAEGADHSQDLGATSAVYLIERSPTKQHPERATVSLEDLTPGDRLADKQNAWQAALEKGWTKLKEPLVLERTAAGEWCRSYAGECVPGDGAQKEFIELVGRNVDLLGLPPELSSSLDGLDNNGLLSLSLPSSIMKKIGIADRSAIARSRGPGYPASFVASHAEDKTVEATRRAAGVETKVPAEQHVEDVVTFTVDQHCQLLELVHVNSAFSSLSDPFPSRTGIARTFSWRFTPVGN